MIAYNLVKFILIQHSPINSEISLKLDNRHYIADFNKKQSEYPREKIEANRQYNADLLNY